MGQVDYLSISKREKRGERKKRLLWMSQLLHALLGENEDVPWADLNYPSRRLQYVGELGSMPVSWMKFGPKYRLVCFQENLIPEKKCICKYS